MQDFLSHDGSINSKNITVMKTISNPTLLVEQAKDFAFKAHSSHYFPCGRKYTSHLETVAELSRQALQHDSSLDEGILLSTAYLHDSIEDTAVTHEDIFNFFGQNISNAVSALTKNKHLTKSSQIQHSLQRILRQPREIWVTKLADRIANLQQSIFLHDNKWGVDYKEYYRDESILINQTLGKASPYLSQKLSILINIYNRI